MRISLISRKLFFFVIGLLWVPEGAVRWGLRLGGTDVVYGWPLGANSITMSSPAYPQLFQPVAHLQETVFVRQVEQEQESHCTSVEGCSQATESTQAMQLHATSTKLCRYLARLVRSTTVSFLYAVYQLDPPPHCHALKSDMNTV